MNTAQITINGIPFTPAAIAIKNDSLASEDSGRTEDGIMHIYYIKPYLNKLEITLPPIKQGDLGDWTPIFNIIRGATTFSVTYYDPFKGSWVYNKQMYCSNASGDVYNGVLYNGMWQGIKFSLIETGAN